jgi:hypothetical protein
MGLAASRLRCNELGHTIASLSGVEGRPCQISNAQLRSLR